MSTRVDLTTARGAIPVRTIPAGLYNALRLYDDLRAEHGYEGADNVAATQIKGPLERLRRGLRSLSFMGVCRIATRHSHVCPVYVRGHMSTLTTLMGLFWWNDGGSTVRERLLVLAWKKGYRP